MRARPIPRRRVALAAGPAADDKREPEGTSRRARPLALFAALLFAAPTTPAEITAHPSLLRYTDVELRLPDAAAHRVVLGPGTVLYLFEDRTLPLVDVAAALRVGTYLEPPDRAGLARLTGALLRRGGAGERSAEELDDRIDALGLKMDSGIGETRGGASLSATTWTLGEGLELFFDMLARPRFQPDRFENARDGVLESLGRRNDEPLDVLEREWQWLLYGADHYSTRPPTPASVGAVTREELVAFHRRWFRPRALLLAVAGDVRRQELVPELERRLAAWSAADPAPPAPWPPEPSAHAPEAGLYLVPFETPQAKVLMGHRSLPRGKWSPRDRAALRLLSEILGGADAVSRIPGRLRTGEGLVYRATAHFDTGEPIAGDFRVFFETENRRVARALALAREEIERLRREPPHPRELEVVKQAAKSTLRLAFDTAEGAAGWLAEDDLLGRPHRHWRERYRTLGEITPEEIREAARRFLRPEEMLYLVVGRESDVLGTATGDRSELERASGHRLTRLARRDPLTLRPLSE